MAVAEAIAAAAAKRPTVATLPEAEQRAVVVVVRSAATARFVQPGHDRAQGAPKRREPTHREPAHPHPAPAHRALLAHLQHLTPAHRAAAGGVAGGPVVAADGPADMTLATPKRSSLPTAE